MQPVSEVKKLKEWGTVKLKTISEGVLDIKKFIDRKVARKVKEGREEREGYELTWKGQRV